MDVFLALHFTLLSISISKQSPLKLYKTTDLLEVSHPISEQIHTTQCIITFFKYKCEAIGIFQS